MNTSLRADAERHFSSPLLTVAARADAARLADFRASQQLKSATRKSSERLERAKKSGA